MPHKLEGCGFAPDERSLGFRDLRGVCRTTLAKPGHPTMRIETNDGIAPPGIGLAKPPGFYVGDRQTLYCFLRWSESKASGRLKPPKTNMPARHETGLYHKNLNIASIFPLATEL